jgi:hypothetical protein
MLFYSDLRKVCGALSAGNIPVIVLKGAFLACAVYDNIGLRPMRDLDLLVPLKLLDRAQAILDEAGYGPLAEHDRLDGIEVVEIDQHLPVAYRTGGPTAVEAHWSVTPPNEAYTIPVESLWERSLPATVAGTPCRQLCAEDLFLHVAMHLAYMHDFCFGLRPFCDIAAAARRYGDSMDWDAVVCRAREWGWARGAGVALHLSREWLGAAVPDTVIRALLPADFDAGTEGAVVNSVFGSGEVPWNERPSTSFAQMWAGARLRDRLALLRRKLAVDKPTLARQFGVSPSSPWIYLYYPVRLSGLIRRYTPVVGRLVRGDTQEADRLRSADAVKRWLSHDAPNLLSQ